METQKNPHIEILCIGREILDGRVIDTNSVFFGQELGKLGLTPRFSQKVDDDPERMIQAFELAASRSSIVLVTGGLGPTSDDLTAEVFAKFAKLPIEESPIARAQIEAFFKDKNRPMLPVQLKQARLPKGALVLANRIGTAPGFSVRHAETDFYFFPGIPSELRAIFFDWVRPKLPAQQNMRAHSWATQFTSEGELQTRLKTVLQKVPSHFEFTYRTRMPENHLGLIGQCSTTDDTKLFDLIVGEVSTLLGDDFFSQGEIEDLEAVVVKLAKDKRVLLATVESCTGGLMAHRLTQVSGASHVFVGGQITYDNALKVELGVSEQILNDVGSVSAECAQAMAEKSVHHLQKIFTGKRLMCVSSTGIAGPRGGTQSKPVGLCYFAIADSQGPTNVEKFQGRPGLTRAELKNFFSQKGLDLLRRRLLL